MPIPVTVTPFPATCPKALTIPLANPLVAVAVILATPTVNAAPTYPMPAPIT